MRTTAELDLLEQIYTEMQSIWKIGARCFKTGQILLIVGEMKNENMGLLLHSAHDKEREDFQKLSWVGSVA